MNSFLIWFGILPVAGFLALGGRGRERLALWGALALGAFELGYSIALAKGVDYLSLVTFLIMVVFIAASLRTRDDFFFKIHGAITNLATAAAMLIAWYGFHKAMLLDAAEKYVGLDKLAAMNPEVDKEQLSEFFRVLSLQLPIWLIAHAALTVHAAARWSRWAWGLVYLPGLFAAFILAAFFAQALSLGR
jgi:intracellular septation protein A